MISLPQLRHCDEINIGALIIRLRFWGVPYYSYSIRIGPPNPILITKAPLVPLKSQKLQAPSQLLLEFVGFHAYPLYEGFGKSGGI